MFFLIIKNDRKNIIIKLINVDIAAPLIPIEGINNKLISTLKNTPTYIILLLDFTLLMPLITAKLIRVNALKINAIESICIAKAALRYLLPKSRIIIAGLDRSALQPDHP